MPATDPEAPPASFGDWRDAAALRRWSFARRTAQQRLDWLVSALTVRYEAAAVRRAAKASTDLVGARQEPEVTQTASELTRYRHASGPTTVE